MKRKDLDKTPHDELIPGARAAAFGGERVMVNHVILKAGTAVPPHAHPEEQLTLVLRGRIVFELEGETAELGPGEIVWVPANARHAVRVLEDTVVLDVFSPVRADLLERFG